MGPQTNKYNVSPCTPIRGRRLVDEILSDCDSTGGRNFHSPVDFCKAITTVQHCCAACDEPDSSMGPPPHWERQTGEGHRAKVGKSPSINQSFTRMQFTTACMHKLSAVCQRHLSFVYDHMYQEDDNDNDNLIIMMMIICMWDNVACLLFVVRRRRMSVSSAWRPRPSPAETVHADGQSYLERCRWDTIGMRDTNGSRLIRVSEWAEV